MRKLLEEMDSYCTHNLPRDVDGSYRTCQRSECGCQEMSEAATRVHQKRLGESTTELKLFFLILSTMKFQLAKQNERNFKNPQIYDEVIAYGSHRYLLFLMTFYIIVTS